MCSGDKDSSELRQQGNINQPGNPGTKDSVWIREILTPSLATLMRMQMRTRTTEDLLEDAMQVVVDVTHNCAL